MAGVLGMILAGGEGSRLKPLTETRTKPAVPFGGSYRLIDFALNNFVNADLMRIYVLTQFKSQSLYLHMKKGWNLWGSQIALSILFLRKCVMENVGMKALLMRFIKTYVLWKLLPQIKSAFLALTISTRWIFAKCSISIVVWKRN